jgi:F-type H+-transporting ATPase subunit a
MLKGFPIAGFRSLMILAAVLSILALPFCAQAATTDPHGGHEAGSTAAIADHHGDGHDAHAHHALPQYAVPLKQFGPFSVAGKQIGPFSITNSMVVTWIVALLIIIFAQIATRNIREVPQGAQNFWEWLVESLRDFLEGIIGHDLVRKTFWFFATIFIFILFTNWFGLVPGVGTVGWGTTDPQSGLFTVTKPLLRGANADLNMTLAMAMIFFVCWLIWALQANGPGGFILHLFGPKGETTGALKVLMIFVFVAVGVLEVVSILFRPVSLSFRLYGNVFAGESMLEAMAVVYRPLAAIIPIPFYFMELLVGLVQALVFMLLTAVFTLLICQHEEGHESHH